MKPRSYTPRHTCMSCGSDRTKVIARNLHCSACQVVYVLPATQLVPPRTRVLSDVTLHSVSIVPSSKALPHTRIASVR